MRPSVWIDPRLMELAFSNLLVNATKYTENNVRCSLAQKDKHYVLTVEDDGKGIPEDARDMVFKDLCTHQRRPQPRNRRLRPRSCACCTRRRVARRYRKRGLIKKPGRSPLFDKLASAGELNRVIVAAETVDDVIDG